MFSREILFIAALAFLILIIVEVIYAKLVLKAQYYSVADAVTSLNLGIFSQLFSFNGAIILFVYGFVYTHFRLFDYVPHNIWHWLLAILIYDFLYYWAHRLGHEFTLFWSNHVIHHSSEYYNMSTALRQPGILGTHMLFIYLPLALIGISPQMFIFIGLIDLYYQFWVHTQCIGKLGWLDKVMVTPTNHSVHHSVNPSCINKNYGGILIIWDHIFNTYHETDEFLKFGTTKPVKSWNPLWVNFEGYYTFIRDIVYTPGVMQRLKVLFSRTGIRSESAKKRFPFAEFDFNRHEKFLVKNSLTINAYAIFNILICLFGFFTYLVNFSKISQAYSLFYIIVFLLLAVSRSLLLGNKISLAQAIMFDSVSLISLLNSTPSLLTLGFAHWLNILPMIIALYIFFSKRNNFTYNRSFGVGLVATFSAGLISHLSLGLIGVSSILYLLGYSCYAVYLRKIGQLSSLKYEIRPINVLVPAVIYGVVLLILIVRNTLPIYLVAAAIVLLIVGYLAYNGLQLTNSVMISLLTPHRYLFIAGGSLLLLFHDSILFINLQLYQSNLLNGLVTLCYGLGQFLLVSYAPNYNKR